MTTQSIALEKPKESLFKTIWLDYGMVVVLVLLFAGCSLFIPNFFTIRNMQALSLAVSMTGMVACTMMLVLSSGNFDMSCGAVIACSGMVAAWVTNYFSDSLGAYAVYVGVLSALGIGLLVGLVNGVTIAYAGINALITTLATMQITRGFGYLIGRGKSIGVVEESFFTLGTYGFTLVIPAGWITDAPLRFSITLPVIITLICFIVFGVILEMTSFGRNSLAIGGNEEAANLAGIRVSRHKLKLFVIHGLMSGFAGVVLASRMTSGQPMTSQGFELDVISACVLGGVSMAGGIASIWFVFAGVMIMGIVQNSMNLQNVPTFYQYIARGSILLVAVIFDRFKQRR